MATDLTQQIADTATEPAKVSSDTISVEQRSLSELVQADEHLRRVGAAKQRKAGIEFRKLIPPGGA